MERETRVLTTKHGVEVVIKTYLTGGEFRQAQAILLKGADIEAGGEGGLKGVKGEAIADYESRLVELVVVSVSGKNSDVRGELDNLRADDYMEVMEAVRETATGFFGKPSK